MEVEKMTTEEELEQTKLRLKMVLDQNARNKIRLHNMKMATMRADKAIAKGSAQEAHKHILEAMDASGDELIYKYLEKTDKWQHLIRDFAENGIMGFGETPEQLNATIQTIAKELLK